MSTTVAAPAATAFDWRAGYMRPSADLDQYPWTAWITVASSAPGMHGWDTTALSFATRDECIDAAIAYVRETRRYTHSVLVWHRPSQTSRAVKGDKVTMPRKAPKIRDYVAKIESLRAMPHGAPGHAAASCA